MRYTSVLDASEQSFQNLINDAEDFENDKIFASIRSRDYDESDINLINAEVRISIAKIEKEYISLEKFSKEFNKLYATDHNQCYDTALKLCRKLRSTLAGTKKLFRKMCPIIRKKAGGNEAEKKLSVFDHSYLTGLTFSKDMFGLESYPDCVKELCCAVSLFFCKLTGVMALCREIIAKENYIRCHPDLCYKIYKDNYDNVAKKSRDTIKYIENNSGITYQMNSLKERMDKAKSLQQVICDCFHTYNESQFQNFVIFDTIAKGKKDNLSPIESLLWPNNHDLAKQVRFVITHLDDLIEPCKLVGLKVLGRTDKKEGKHHIYGPIIVMIMEWAGITGTGKEAKFNRYFNETYRGNLLPPGNSGTNGAKNNKKYTTEEYNLFVSEVSKLTKNMNKAMNISISSIACAN